MNRTARMSVVLAAALVLAPLAFTACGGGSEEAEAQAAREARLAELEQQKQELDAAREELADRNERLRQARAGELPEGEEVDVTQLQTEIAQQDSQITTMADDLNGQLTEFINQLGEQLTPPEGEPMPEVMQEAIDLKAEEDVTLAKEHITQGGDYARAIDMYKSILAYAPDNERVKEALAEAEEQRYMTEERFSQVKRGMTQGEVAEVLGPVYFRNQREYPDQGVEAWFYPKSAERDAAAVYFRKDGDRWVVFRTDFNLPRSDQGSG